MDEQRVFALGQRDRYSGEQHESGAGADFQVADADDLTAPAVTAPTQLGGETGAQLAVVDRCRRDPWYAPGRPIASVDRREQQVRWKVSREPASCSLTFCPHPIAATIT